VGGVSKLLNGSLSLGFRTRETAGVGGAGLERHQDTKASSDTNLNIDTPDTIGCGGSMLVLCSAMAGSI
jgi:hypothetical protein